MYCQNCGAEILIEEKVCRNCGTIRPGAKFCQHCAQAIDSECIVCPKCGKQVAELYRQPYQQPNIIINNANNNMNTANAFAGGYGRPKDKWVALLLCLFLGVVGGHKFYEGKVGMGILYICTGGICGIAVLFDLIVILMKPNPYYV